MDHVSSSKVEKQAIRGAIIVVAKCPIAGKSKTRLMPLLGKDGSSKLAKAMLSDILLTIDNCEALSDDHHMQKILLYAPGNEEGKRIMEKIMDDIGCGPNNKKNNHNSWDLMPVVYPTEEHNNLRSSDLGDMLQNAYERTKQRYFGGNNGPQPPRRGGIVFVGMDSPVLPLQDIVHAIHNSSSHRSIATICPADDGGYGMLCIPTTTSLSSSLSSTMKNQNNNNDPNNHNDTPVLAPFQNVLWSQSLTAISQIKTLTDQNIQVVIGQLMYDIDEPEDTKKLCQRLLLVPQPQQPQNCNNSDKKETTEKQNTTTSSTNNHKVLDYSCQAVATREIETETPPYHQKQQQQEIFSTHPSCYYTRKALMEANIF